jgi:hypothetical protein
MLRLKAAAAVLLVAVACGTTTPPTELHTAAAPPAVALAGPARPTLALLEITTTTAPPPTTTTVAPPPPPPTTVVSAPPPVSPQESPQHPRPAGNCGGWADEVALHFPPEQVAKACAVMGCETGHTYDPTIHNPSSTASGLFQFLDGTWRKTTGLAPPAASYPAGQQIAAAAALWRSSGWAPWACA